MEQSSTILDLYENDSYLDTMHDLHIDCLQQPNSAACITATALGILASVAIPAIVALGCIGNLLTAHILLIRMRTKRSVGGLCNGNTITRQHVYLGCISLSDVGNLISWGLAWQFLARGLPWISGGTTGFIIPNVSDAVCRSFRFVHNFFHTLSANWFLMMTLDRLAALYMPLHVRSLSPKDAGQALAVVAVITLLMVAPVPVFIGWHFWRGRIACLAVPFYGHGVQVWTILSNALLMLPPTLQLLLIAVLNMLLLVRLRQRFRRVVNQNNGSTVASSLRTNRTRELGPTVQVLTLSAIFLISSLPTCVVAMLVLHRTVFARDGSAQVLRSVLNIGDIGQILMLTNQAANWLVLIWRDRRFRAHLVDMARQSGPHQTTGPSVSGCGGSLRGCSSMTTAVGSISRNLSAENAVRGSASAKGVYS